MSIHYPEGEAQTRKHCKEHGGTSFEPATKE